MRIEQFKQLIAIVDEKAMTKAAAKLNITQPALSISMKNFEKSLGFDIFDKVGRTLNLTQQGEEVYLCAKRIIKDFEVMENICTTQDIKSHTLNISNSFSISAKDTLIDILNLMKSQEITCRFEDCSIMQSIENVFTGISELGIIRYPAYKQSYLNKIFESKHIECHVMTYENACIVAGSKNPLYHIESDSIHYEHVRPYPFITYVNEIKDSIWMSFFKDLELNDSKISLANLMQAIDTVKNTNLLFIDTKKDPTHANFYGRHQIRYIELEPKIPCALSYIKIKDKNLSSIGQTYINLLKKKINIWKKQ